MTTEDILTTLYKEVNKWGLGITTYKRVHPPVTLENNFERVVVNTLARKDGSWSEGFANINIFVPDVSVGSGNSNYRESNFVRLKALETIAVTKLNRGLVTSVGSQQLCFSVDAVGVEEDPQTYSHFINIRLQFQFI